jgi:hypothetical protein
VRVEVLLWRELVARAGTAWAARKMVADGEVRRVWPGAYVAADLPDTPEVRAKVLRRLLPDGVALSGRAAVWALGVDVGRRDGGLDVTTERGKHLLARPGVHPHTALLPACELVDLPGGLVAVSAARAVVDVARREPLVEAVAFADAVLRSGAAREDQIHSSLRRAAGLRGVVGARRILPHLEPRSESQGESRLRMRLVLAGLPRPEAQVDYYDEHGRHLARVDLVLEGVALEYDGREQRLRKDVFSRDRQRQNEVVDRGVELRRFTAPDVSAARQRVLAADVRRAMTLAATRPSPAVLRGPDTLRPPALVPVRTRAETAMRRSA